MAFRAEDISHKRRPVDRFKQSLDDGTQQGGLGFWVGLFAMFVLVSVAIPGALFTFWGWFLCLLGGTALGFFCFGLARWNNARSEPEDPEESYPTAYDRIARARARGDLDRWGNGQ